MALLKALAPWRTDENTGTSPADADASSAGYGGETIGTSTGETGWRNPNPSNEIAQAIADREEIATEELPPLYDSVDTDGLNAVLRSAPNATVTFPFRGYEVTVTGSGEVNLTPVDAE